MKTQATAKFVGTSARKTGLVAALIRGQRALDAQTILQHTSKAATVPVGKVLASAIANAENNHNARPAELVIETVYIGPGPTLKRSRARAKGSSASIKKRSSHITIVLSDAKARAAKAPVVADNAGAATAQNTDKPGTDAAAEEKK